MVYITANGKQRLLYIEKACDTSIMCVIYGTVGNVVIYMAFLSETTVVEAW